MLVMKTYIREDKTHVCHLCVRPDQPPSKSKPFQSHPRGTTEPYGRRGWGGWKDGRRYSTRTHVLTRSPRRGSGFNGVSDVRVDRLGDVLCSCREALCCSQGSGHRWWTLGDQRHRAPGTPIHAEQAETADLSGVRGVPQLPGDGPPESPRGGHQGPTHCSRLSGVR